jgi:hypothetical protein
MGVIPLFVMSKEDIEKRLEAGKRATGIPVKDLRWMCLEGGLDLLESGDLKIRKRVSVKSGEGEER